MERWVNKGVIQLGCFYSSLGMKSSGELQIQYNLDQWDFLKYLQIRDFLSKKGLGEGDFKRFS